MDIDRLKTQLMVDEGVRLDAYKCPAGYLTVGAGRNLDTNPLTTDEILVVGHDGRTKSITREQAAYLLSADIDRVVLALDKLIPGGASLMRCGSGC